MRKLLVTAFSILLLSSCGSYKAQVESLQTTVDRMKTDSLLLEKRVRGLGDENIFLANKCASIEQAYNNRLQEKEDSLRINERLLKEREFNLTDLKSRNEQEGEAFLRLSETVFQPLKDLNQQGMNLYNECSRMHAEVSDRMLFAPNTLKPVPSQLQVLAAVADALKKNPDLRLIILAHTDPSQVKEKADDQLSAGSLKANTLMRSLVKDMGVAEQQVISASQGAALSSSNTGVSRGRVDFILYSVLLPCVHGR